MTIRICPSILNADHTRMNEEIDRVVTADLLHLDVMDNVFVPNKTFTFAECEEIISFSQIPVDSHLMIQNPDQEAARYAVAGSASVTFHWEASLNPRETIEAIKVAGARVGVAIKPETPFSEVRHIVDEIDMLLVMTVEPGFGGQSFMADQLPKVKEAREFISELTGPRPWLQVDGGISLETILQAADSGADTFVAGSAIYRSDSPAGMIAELRKRAQGLS
jgi:ribulose-phosphate 3-epimerase